MPLKKRLREDQERRAQLRRQAAATSRQAPVDQRIRRIVPPADGEVGPVVAEVDRVLADNDTESPPMRRPDGTLVELRTQSPFNLHQLVANGSNAAAVDSGQLPAPPEPLLVRMTPVTVGGMVEKHFVWEKRDHNGVFLYNAQLPAPFINAFMQMPGSVSKLPHVNAINTAPMVAENGAII